LGAKGVYKKRKYDFKSLKFIIPKGSSNKPYFVKEIPQLYLISFIVTVNQYAFKTIILSLAKNFPYLMSFIPHFTSLTLYLRISKDLSNSKILSSIRL
jgi:hypothetical protein